MHLPNLSRSAAAPAGVRHHLAPTAARCKPARTLRVRSQLNAAPGTTHMAGGSGLLPQVFISHTGQDENGRVFAANILQPALEQAGLTTFIDHANLELGCDWPAELVKAASTSAVFVVVLTQSYLTRFWCLRELDLALNGHPNHPRGAKPYIIPAYLQHPSDWQKVSPDQVWKKIQDRMEKLQQAGAQGSPELQDLQRMLLESHPTRMLQQNLQELANIESVRRQHQSTMPLQPQPQQQQLQQPEVQQAESPSINSASRVVPPPKDEEWQIARKVAAAALLQLPAKQLLAYLPPDLVGYEQQLAKLAAQLVVDEPGMLGLWLHGPGGSGKTTMARMLFNTLSSSKQFTKAAMVSLHLEGSSELDLNRHLVMLLQGLGPPGEAAPTGDNTQLLQLLAELVCSKDHKVLLVLDNVNHDAQLNSLLPSVFSSGSRVIITSRVRALPSSSTYQALTRSGASSLHHHQMQNLDQKSARDMFRQCHGLGQQQLQKLGLCKLEEGLLQACSGLPLALQVIGSVLRADEDDSSAHDTIKLWKEVSAFRIGLWAPTDMSSSEAVLQDVVYYSFSKLSPAAQNMFLDSISVLQGQPVSKAMLVWEAWWPGQAQQAFRRLQRLSLISTKPEAGFAWLIEGPYKQGKIRNERLTSLDVIRCLGQSILLKPDRADRLGDEYIGSRIWVTSRRYVQGLIQGRQPVGVNLTGYSGDSHRVLQCCDVSKTRILISRDLPPEVLCLAPHLLWIGSLLEDSSWGPVVTVWESFGGSYLDTVRAAARPLGTPACLQTLVVMDLLVSGVSNTWQAFGYSDVCIARQKLVAEASRLQAV